MVYNAISLPGDDSIIMRPFVEDFFTRRTLRKSGIIEGNLQDLSDFQVDYLMECSMVMADEEKKEMDKASRKNKGKSRR